MAQEFIDMLEQYWAESRTRPPDNIVVQLGMVTPETVANVAPHQLKAPFRQALELLENDLEHVYLRMGEPSSGWLELLEQRKRFDVADTLATSVLLRSHGLAPNKLQHRAKIRTGELWHLSTSPDWIPLPRIPADRRYRYYTDRISTEEVIGDTVMAGIRGVGWVLAFLFALGIALVVGVLSGELF